MSAVAPICPYCQRQSVLVGGDIVYPHRPDLAAKKFWRCPHEPCDAYVGCHPDTDSPMGRLANLALRQAKQAAHAWFDRRWRTQAMRGRTAQGVARTKAYAWLASQMGIARSDCHIGQMDTPDCLRVIAICKAAEESSK